MARHIQPREVAKLKGATKVHPERYRKELPESGYPLGQPPEYMPEDAKACWFELETYALKGVLTGSDRVVMELASTWLAHFREDPKKFTAAMATHLRGALASMGLTPSDRQKLGTEKPPEDNPFSEF